MAKNKTAKTTVIDVEFEKVDFYYTVTFNRVYTDKKGIDRYTETVYDVSVYQYNRIMMQVRRTIQMPIIGKVNFRRI